MREVTPAKTLQQLAKLWDVEADYVAELARYCTGQRNDSQVSSVDTSIPSFCLSLHHVDLEPEGLVLKTPESAGCLPSPKYSLDMTESSRVCNTPGNSRLRNVGAFNESLLMQQCNNVGPPGCGLGCSCFVFRFSCPNAVLYCTVCAARLFRRGIRRYIESKYLRRL